MSEPWFPARTNAAVLRTLRALLARLHGLWNDAELLDRARTSGREAELGMVLELAGRVFHRNALVELAHQLLPSRSQSVRAGVGKAKIA